MTAQHALLGMSPQIYHKFVPELLPLASIYPYIQAFGTRWPTEGMLQSKPEDDKVSRKDELVGADSASRRREPVVDHAEALQTHVKGLRRYAMALTGDPSEADDLVQETLKRMLIHSRKGRTVRDVRAYLFTILHNVRMDSLAKRNKMGLVVPLTDTAVQTSQPPSQDIQVEFRELAHALRRLPEEQRQVILLVALEGLSYRGAAEVLGIPIGTVMSRLNRGREAVRRMMGQDEESRWRRAQ